MITRVLVVDDDAADAELIVDCLMHRDRGLSIDVLGDGQAALERLPTLQPLPRLVLLDLNLPKVDGREVLRQVRSDRRLRRVPVVVLSSSASDEDVRSAYEGGANAYVVKPMNLSALRHALDVVAECFLVVASPTPD